MHRALQLNSRMERMVGDLMAGARLSAGSFGCVHARVESDIYEMARVAGGPSRRESIMPSKDDYVAWARQLAHTSAAENNGSYPVYVASSDPLDLADGHGVRFVQSAYKTGFDSTSQRGGVNVSYLLASLIDFSVCRRARWFIGFSLSSFTRILAELRALELQRGWHSACKSGLRFFPVEQLSVLHRNWSLCPINCARAGVVSALGGFGWTISCARRER